MPFRWPWQKRQSAALVAPGTSDPNPGRTYWFRWLTPLSDEKLTLREELSRYFETSASQEFSSSLMKLLMQQMEAHRNADEALGSLPLKAPAPDFTLPNPTGEPVRLYDLLEKGPVVLTFYRGTWCPFCNISMRALQKRLSAFQELPSTLVALTAQLPEQNLNLQKGASLDFQVLSDSGYEVAKQYGVAFTLSSALQQAFERAEIPLAYLNGPAGADKMVNPGTYVISQEGLIAWKFIDPAAFPEPEEVLAAVHALVV